PTQRQQPTRRHQQEQAQQPSRARRQAPRQPDGDEARTDLKSADRLQNSPRRQPSKEALDAEDKTDLTPLQRLKKQLDAEEGTSQ
ncbi:MAG: hypothetical protein ACLFVJ_22900, partial [Persicimonas sp.]